MTCLSVVKDDESSPYIVPLMNHESRRQSWFPLLLPHRRNFLHGLLKKILGKKKKNRSNREYGRDLYNFYVHRWALYGETTTGVFGSRFPGNFSSSKYLFSPSLFRCESFFVDSKKKKKISIHRYILYDVQFKLLLRLKERDSVDP